MGAVRTPAVRPAWQEPPRRVTTVAKGVVIAAITLVMLYPFVYVIAISFSAADAARSGDTLLIPAEFSLAAYRTIFAGDVVTRALLVSAGVTLAGTLLSVVMTVTLAYGLMRTREVPGSKFVLYLVLFTMLFGAGIIPNYLLVKELGLLDTYASLILPGAVSAFNLVVVRNFFMNLPQELFDSARIDGASEAQILWRIVVPLSKAVIAVIALFYGVAYWNDFFNAMIYLNDSEKWPIQLVLQQYVLQGSPLDQMAVSGQVEAAPKTIQMAVVVVATVPILLVYPFLQRFFTKGVLTGAIKG